MKKAENDLTLDLASKNNLDGEIYLFTDIHDIALPDEPLKMGMPIFVLCIAGKGKVRINLNEYEVVPNTILAILPDHIMHGYEISSDFEALFLCVTSQYAEQLSVNVHTLLPFVLGFRDTPILALSEKEIGELREIYTLLYKKVENASRFYDRRVIKALMTALLFEMLNVYRERNITSPKFHSRNDEIFHDFIHLVESEFKTNRSVAYYAQKLCITPKHLSAAVKTASGKTAGGWIDRYVVMSAKVLLGSSTKTIKEISSELNFANQSFFGKFFRQHVGISPNKFRSEYNATGEDLVEIGEKFS